MPLAVSTHAPSARAMGSGAKDPAYRIRKRSRSSTGQEYDADVATSISTHVLDTEHGEPARGVRVELFRGDLLLSVRETDEDGRIPDLGGVELPPDVYKLVFHPRSPFFRGVEVEVELADGHYHVPLLLSPYSCVIYRGS